ncbi:MAG: SGNH/GDSL hydrolase family protein [Candidatus Eisenbacteria bacterium]|uniref:SGNH/GDSL hydrolase family protein n=1 Tax=Eiseniibacteriota bacterium TaxID=2212470 RepID=A0A849SMH2_UNCEI|nr:SGNH/GDSL hydrolase family protein [Candidatus Eisenbacteria bacterium]
MLCLGDSYTVGEGVSAAERWPERLAAALAVRGSDPGIPQVIARTGWTVDELTAAIDHERPRGSRRLVTLLIGVNDQYRGHTLAAYEPAFRSLLARAIGFAGGHAERVLVISIPDWGVSPFAADRDRTPIAHAIDTFNASNRAAAEAAGARWVEITDLTRSAGADSAAYTSDGLHPSAAMHARWLERLVPAALAVLGTR